MSPQASTAHAHRSARHTGESRAWLALPAALLALQAGALILTGHPAGSWEYDHTYHHMPAIRTFAESLPTPDLANYRSATSPGWHLALAALLRAGASEEALRWASMLAGVVLMIVATLCAARWVSPRTAALLLAPLALSPFVVGGSAWVTTDVPALACVACALAATLRGLRPSLVSTDASDSRRAWRPWLAGLWATLGVAVRQPLIWLCAPIAWRALRERRWPALAITLVPAALLACMVLAWGGLVPPAYRDQHGRGANPAGAVLVLAMIGAWGAPLALALAWADDARRTLVRPAAIGALVGGVLASLVATSYAKGEGGIEGRWGGPIWSAVERLPAPADRSVLLVALAALGGATLAIMIRQCRLRGSMPTASLVLLSLACVAATNAANSQAWQRYADLPLLLLVPWLAALSVRTTRAATLVALAAVLVALAQAGMATVNLWKPALTAPVASGGPLG